MAHTICECEEACFCHMSSKELSDHIKAEWTEFLMECELHGDMAQQFNESQDMYEDYEQYIGEA